jgi:multiple sugar transport system substrate-binding protein
MFEHHPTPAKQVSLWTTLIVLAILTIGLTAACGTATPAPSLSPAGPSPTVTVPYEMPVTIAIAGRFDDRTLAILGEQIALFEAQNPDVQVAVLSASRREARRHETFVEKLSQGDASRDIYVLDPNWLAEFEANDWLVHLDEYVSPNQINLDDFFPATVQANTLDGQLVALPWLIDGGLLYYRRDLLEQYGYEPPETWADLRQIALEILDQEDLGYGHVWQGVASESLTCNTLEFVWAYGGNVLDQDGNPVFDTDQTRTGLQQMADLVSLGISPAEIAAYTESTALADFQRGEAVFMRNWAYAWERLSSADSPLAGQVGLAPLPVSCLGGQSLALSTHSLYPEQAARFMAFLVDQQQQLQHARQGVQPPALEKVYHDPDLLVEKPLFQDLHAALSSTRARPQSPAYRALSEAIYTEVHKMLQAEQDAATTATIIQRQLETILR